MGALHRIAVVGTGTFGRRRAEAFARRGLRVAFVSRDRGRAEAATRAAGGDPDKATDRLEGIFDWADGVYIATPPALHVEAVLAAVRAGKAVLVEKPVARTLEGARALANELGPLARRVTVAENYRFLPALPALRRAAAEVGPLARARLVAERARAPRDWRVDPALAGGGVLLDIGVHFIHVFRLLLGELTVEAARETVRAPGGGVDLEIALEGRGTSGARFSIQLSWAARVRRSAFVLEGARGNVRHKLGRPLVWRPFPRLPLFAGFGDGLGQEALVDDWLAASARDEPGGATLAEAIQDLAVADAAYRLAR